MFAGFATLVALLLASDKGMKRQLCDDRILPPLMFDAWSSQTRLTAMRLSLIALLQLATT